MVHPFMKITLQQCKQKIQPLPQRKLLIIHQPELSSLKKRYEVVYCVTIEQSIEIYHNAYFADLNNRRGYALYIYIFLVVFFGIYGNNRNPRDEKMAKKKKNVLCIKTKLFIVPPFRKKKRLYTNNWAL